MASPKRTKDFSNIPTDQVGRELLERVFNYRLEPFKQIDESRKAADFIQFSVEENQTEQMVNESYQSNVDVLVKINGWSYLSEKHFLDIESQLLPLISQYNPQTLLFLVFHFIESKLADKLTESITSRSQREGFEFRIFDIYWITKKLKGFPDIEQKYFGADELTVDKSGPVMERKVPSSDTEVIIPKIEVIRSKIIASKGKNHWWINAKDNWTIDKLEIGKPTPYRAKGIKGNYLANVRNLVKGELLIGYQGSPEKCIKGILEVLDEAGTKDFIKLKLLYLFQNQTTYSQLKEKPLFGKSGLARQLQGSFKKLDFKLFSEIINTTEIKIPKDAIKEVVPTHRDSPAIVDKLNREPLANSLCKEIREIWRFEDPDNPSSNKLYTIHVQGPWGAGKSTFLNLIEKNLTKNNSGEEESWIVIKYNAWKNQHIDPPWWTLIESIYNQAAEKVPNRSSFKIKEWWRRTKTGNRQYLYLTMAILLITVFLSFLVLPAVFTRTKTEISKKTERVDNGDEQITTTLTETTNNDKSLLEKFSVVLTLITGLLITARSFYASIKSTLLPGTISSVKSFMDLSRDPLKKIKSHYAGIIESTRKPVVIFVDDLDRCNPKYTVDFLEGLLTLFKEPKVLYIIAADKKWVANCFEIQYEKFSKNYDQRGTSLGYHFIQKAFQLSVKLPEIKDTEIQKYWRYILKAEKDEPEKISEHKVQTEKRFKDLQTEEQIYDEIEKQSEEKGFTDPVVLSAAVDKFSEPEISAQTQQHILEDFSCYLEPNPRAIKRLANYYNLFRNSLVLEGKIIEKTYIIRWLILSQRWPILSEELEKDSSLIDKDAKAIKNEKLRDLFSRPEVKLIVKGKDDEKKPLTHKIIDKLIGS